MENFSQSASGLVLRAAENCNADNSTRSLCALGEVALHVCRFSFRLWQGRGFRFLTHDDVELDIDCFHDAIRMNVTECYAANVLESECQILCHLFEQRCSL